MVGKGSYKGYEIQAVPYHLIDRDGWTIDIYISRHSGSHTRIRKFGNTDTCGTKLEAITRSLEFGERIIDGQLLSCSVADL